MDLPTNGLENGDIDDIVDMEGIEVWGQSQDDIEKQALTHLQSLTNAKSSTNDNATDIEEGEISENSDEKLELPNKPVASTSIFNFNKYLESQNQLRNSHELKKFSNISEKSKNAAQKIAEVNLEKQNNKSGLGQAKKLKVLKKDAPVNIIKHDIDIKDVKRKTSNESDSDYYPSEEYDSEDGMYEPEQNAKVGLKRKINKKSNEINVKDDGLLANYESRMQYYDKNSVCSEEQECIEDNLKIPKNIWERLYSYQQDGVNWLWNIHKLSVGGLLGDEMGLGKTVQVIVFLAAMEYSQIRSSNGMYCGVGPSIIVCPATVIHQWVKHFHEWWPPFRVALLHQSGTYPGNKIQLINDINKSCGFLITTYGTIIKYAGVLFEKNWHYVILDEGHKIRNPSAQITVAVKRFRTPHKLILTGSPMQNNLQELWSLYDFIVPGKLGSQQAFMDYFATPITHGGYANATPMQETTALLIATSLKNMISPYMLRRTKDEVKDCIFLPSKSEQVLFCSLSDEQKDLYRGYLLSDHIGAILGRVKAARCSENQCRANILGGITVLRKICNHPDLYLGEADDFNNSSDGTQVPPDKTFGYYKRSGKMIVVAALLKIWKKQGHRALLFTQTRSMVDIFEDFLTHLEYKYLKMDGTTSISNRQTLIETFNQDISYNVFLLTTRVGGLGVNLTGADRVIIYDPDWNPATDIQARERAWRIGQKRDVTVYRLVSAGTIEEKMYQRQIWKQLLSNKILIDPKTKRFFKTSDLNDLFSFQESEGNETANIFKNSKVELQSSKDTSEDNSLTDTSVTFSKDKIDAMKALAQKISKNLSQDSQSSENSTENTTVYRPSPVELLAINRNKLKIKEEPIVNKIDDCKTNTSFSEALSVAEKVSKNYHKKGRKHSLEEKNKNDKNQVNNGRIDISGQIEGEKIENLVKREVKKKEKPKKDFSSHSNEDDYVLEKLFSKKGVHTALRHDVIVQSGNQNKNSLKIHYEAKQKADMALKALRKSRLNNWSW